MTAMAAAQAAAFGEATDYRPTAQSGSQVRVTAQWGPIEPAEIGYGVVVDTRLVVIEVAGLLDEVGDLQAARDTARLVRYPADLEQAEEWEAMPGDVRRDGPNWVLRVMRKTATRLSGTS